MDILQFYGKHTLSCPKAEIYKNLDPASNQEYHLGNNDDGGNTEFKVTWKKE
jgi:hypothetical protein